MRIDSHQHFWRYDAANYGWIDDSMTTLRRDFLPDDARQEMNRARIDACVAVQARQTLDETDWLLGLADAHPFIAGVVGWVDLEADDVAAQLERVAEHPKLIGVRHIVQSEPDDHFMLRSAFCRGVSMLGDFNLTYDILGYPRHLPVAAELVSRYPRQRFVLDHLGKPDIRSGDVREWERSLRHLAALPNVVCKLSGLVTEADWAQWTPDRIYPFLDVAFDCFGAGRLLVGSDWPVCTVAADYSATIDLIDGYLAGHTAATREAVMGGNAVQFWNLRQRSSTGELV